MNLKTQIWSSLGLCMPKIFGLNWNALHLYVWTIFSSYNAREEIRSVDNSYGSVYNCQTHKSCIVQNWHPCFFFFSPETFVSTEIEWNTMKGRKLIVFACTSNGKSINILFFKNQLLTDWIGGSFHSSVNVTKTVFKEQMSLISLHWTSFYKQVTDFFFF